jgi:hypothetical protein
MLEGSVQLYKVVDVACMVREYSDVNVEVAGVLSLSELDTCKQDYFKNYCHLGCDVM